MQEEIGDGWLYGVPSDPLRNAMLREADRQRTACVSSGRCDPDSNSTRNPLACEFWAYVDRLLGVTFRLWHARV